MFSLAFRVPAWLLVLVLAVAMLGAARIGVAIARRHPRTNEGDATLEAAVFALLGLLLAFTFSMAGERYDGQRKLIAEEANAIGTATLRSDLYPEPERAGFRDDFREYLEARIADGNARADIPRILEARARSTSAQMRLWARASRFAREDPKALIPTTQMAPALNQMIDAAGRRFAAEQARVPDSIIYLIFAMSILATFLYAYLGARVQHFEWFTAGTFVLVAASVVFVTLELDRPRRGLIDVNVSERSIVELRSLFGPTP